MFNVDEAKDSVSFTISSEMKLVDRVVKEVREFLAESGIEEGFSGIKLVLRELLINAVEHGNTKIPSKTVKCSVKMAAPALCETYVEDEGAGFDWRKVDLQLPDTPDKLRKRGFPLVNAIADKIEFNERGNAVKAFVSLHKKTVYAVSVEGEWTVITPSGDITAANSDSLREVLSTLVLSGMRRCRFDFTGVADIDSVGLSAMIVLSRAMKERGVEKPHLEVSNAPPDIQKLFRMTMLDSIYKLTQPKANGTPAPQEAMR